MITVKEKSAAVESKPEVPRFPRLMKSIHNGLVILFSCHGKGVILDGGSAPNLYDNQLGKEVGGWAMSAFTDCGPIEISNVE